MYMYMYMYYQGYSGYSSLICDYNNYSKVYYVFTVEPPIKDPLRGEHDTSIN